MVSVWPRIVVEDEGIAVCTALVSDVYTSKYMVKGIITDTIPHKICDNFVFSWR